MSGLDLLRLLAEMQGMAGGAGVTEIVTPQIKIPIPHDIAAAVQELPAGQRRTVEGLIGAGYAVTYAQAAQRAGVSMGTLHTHLRRVREGYPILYSAVMGVRARQLGVRHSSAMLRAAEHSKVWHRKRANVRFFKRFGYWPRKRWGS